MLTMLLLLHPQSCVEDGRQVREVKVTDWTNAVSWNPKQYILAYCGDDRTVTSEADKGIVHLLVAASS